MRILMHRGNPECLTGDGHLEPCPFPRFPGFPDGDAGDGQDLAGEEEPEAGIFPETLGKYPVLVGIQDAHAVILAYDDTFAVLLFPGEPDGGNLPAVPDGIIHE